MWVYACECRFLWSSNKSVWSPSGVAEYISCLIWVLGTYLQSFTRKASTLSHEPSPSPIYLYIVIYTSACLYVWRYMCEHDVYAGALREAIRPFGIGVTSSCELLQVDGGNRTQALEEQHTPLAIEPSLQLLTQILKKPNIFHTFCNSI